MDQEAISDAERQEKLEFAQVTEDMKFILSHNQGRNLIRYLLENLSYGEVPPLGLQNDMLRDMLGTLRAAKSIFELAAIADPETAGIILAQIERKKHA